MRKQFIATLAVLALTASSAAAQTTVTARAGTDSGEYRFVEAIHVYDGGLTAGAGYTDLGDPRDYTSVGANQDGYGGVGYTFDIGGVSVSAIAFVSQQNGPSEGDAYTSLVPWFVASKQIGFIVGSANYFTYVPQGDGDRPTIQVLENAKAEYVINGDWLAGVGYAATKVGDGPWMDKPFLTVTRKTGIGAFELWLQRASEGASTFQLRYLKTFGQ